VAGADGRRNLTAALVVIAAAQARLTEPRAAIIKPSVPP